jgi:hypothetical protein
LEKVNQKHFAEDVFDTHDGFRISEAVVSGQWSVVSDH